MARVGNNHNCIDTHSEEINQSVIHQEKNLSTSQQSVLEQHEASHDKVSVRVTHSIKIASKNGLIVILH